MAWNYYGPGSHLNNRPDRQTGSMADWKQWVDGLSRYERDQLYPGMHIDLIPAYEKIEGMSTPSPSETNAWTSNQDPMGLKENNFEGQVATPKLSAGTTQHETPTPASMISTATSSSWLPTVTQHGSISGYHSQPAAGLAPSFTPRSEAFSPTTLHPNTPTSQTSPISGILHGIGDAFDSTKTSMFEPTTINSEAQTEKPLLTGTTPQWRPLLNTPTPLNTYAALPLLTANAIDHQPAQPIGLLDLSYTGNKTSPFEVGVKAAASAISQDPQNLTHNNSKPQTFGIIPNLSNFEEMSIEEIKAEYEKIARYGGWLGYKVAADNLRHFLGASGSDRYIEEDWLQKFSVVREAVDENVDRFLEDGNSNTKAALQSLQPGESATAEDYYVIPVHAKLRSKLYYASAYSTLTSTGNFKLYCDDEGNVDIDGTVWHEWTDRYDWQEGEYAAFKVLNKEFYIPDDAAIRLVNAGEADNFDMFSTWQEEVGWFVPAEAR